MITRLKILFLFCNQIERQRFWRFERVLVFLSHVLVVLSLNKIKTADSFFNWTVRHSFSLVFVKKLLLSTPRLSQYNCSCSSNSRSLTQLQLLLKLFFSGKRKDIQSKETNPNHVAGVAFCKKYVSFYATDFLYLYFVLFLDRFNRKILFYIFLITSSFFLIKRFSSTK